MLSRLPRCQLIPRLGPISVDEIKMLTMRSHILRPLSCGLAGFEEQKQHHPQKLQF